MYNLIIFLHVIGVFGFLLAHGVSMGVMLQLRRERNVAVIRALLDLSILSLRIMYVFFILLVVAGVIAGFIGNWWGRWWIWTALALLVVTYIVMGALGSGYFTKIRQALGIKPYRTSEASSAQIASEAELNTLLSSSQPLIVTGIGFIALVLILWLMMFKPF